MEPDSELGTQLLALRSALSLSEGLRPGKALGTMLGASFGTVIGLAEGAELGTPQGSLLGAVEGSSSSHGMMEGATLALAVGCELRT